MKKLKPVKLIIPAAIIALICVTPVVYISSASETSSTETSNKSSHSQSNVSKNPNPNTYVSIKQDSINDLNTLRNDSYKQFNSIYRKTAEINNEYDGNPDKAQLNNECLQVYDLWNSQLNSIYGRLETILPNEEFLRLKAKESDWNNTKGSVATSYAQSSSGNDNSNYTMMYYTKLTELTRERCYYLLNNYTE